MPLHKALTIMLIQTQKAVIYTQEAGNEAGTSEIRFEGKIGTQETRRLLATRRLLTALNSSAGRMNSRKSGLRPWVICSVRFAEPLHRLVRQKLRHL